jgi:hypothetical protein
MRFLRGPYFAIVCIVAVAAGVALGWLWFPRAAPPTPADAGKSPDAQRYHEQAAIIRELEPVFQRMDEALVKALAPHNPVCDGPGGVCTSKSDPGLGSSGRPAFGNLVSARRAGNFRNIILSVSRLANTAAQFTLTMSIGTADGRLVLSDQEKQSLFRIARGYGFDDPAQATMLAACAGTSPADRARTVTAAGVTFTCRLLGTGSISLEFSGPAPGAS